MPTPASPSASASASSSHRRASSDLMVRIGSADSEIKLRALRELKNQIIGNRTKKLFFLKLGAVPAVSCALAEAQAQAQADLLVQSAAALGSFACGFDAGVRAVLDSGAFSNLIALLSFPDDKVIPICNNWIHYFVIIEFTIWFCGLEILLIFYCLSNYLLLVLGEREREIMLVDCVFQLLRSELLICVYRKNFEFPVYVNYVNYWKWERERGNASIICISAFWEVNYSCIRLSSWVVVSVFFQAILSVFDNESEACHFVLGL